jgi:hypothetical protein
VVLRKFYPPSSVQNCFCIFNRVLLLRSNMIRAASVCILWGLRIVITSYGRIPSYENSTMTRSVRKAWDDTRGAVCDRAAVDGAATGTSIDVLNSLTLI